MKTVLMTRNQGAMFDANQYPPAHASLAFSG
jgi:hypothetical protein